MTATITATNGGGTTTPVTVLSPWETTWSGRNIIHRTLGGGVIVSVVSPDLRAGSYEALYRTEAEAFACIALHRLETSFTLAESDRPYIGMTYFVDGECRVRLDEGTLDLWVVTIGYQEVAP